MKEKRHWQKPGLVVLVRNKSEEAVLTTCKSGVAYEFGAGSQNYGCYDWPYPSCPDCSTLTPS